MPLSAATNQLSQGAQAAQANLVNAIRTVKQDDAKSLATFLTWFNNWLICDTHLEYSQEEKLNASKEVLTNQNPQNIFAAHQLLKAKMEQTVLLAENAKSADIVQGFSPTGLSKCLDEAIKDHNFPDSPGRSAEEQKNLFAGFISGAIKAAQEEGLKGQEYRTAVANYIVDHVRANLQLFDANGIKAIQTDLKIAAEEADVMKAFRDIGSAINHSLPENFQAVDYSNLAAERKSAINKSFVELAKRITDDDGNSKKETLQLATQALNNDQERSYFKSLVDKYQAASNRNFTPDMATALIGKSLPGMLFGLAVGSVFGSGFFGAVLGVIINIFSDEGNQEGINQVAKQVEDTARGFANTRKTTTAP